MNLGGQQTMAWLFEPLPPEWVAQMRKFLAVLRPSPWYHRHLRMKQPGDGRSWAHTLFLFLSPISVFFSYSDPLVSKSINRFLKTHTHIASSFQRTKMSRNLKVDKTFVLKIQSKEKKKVWGNEPPWESVLGHGGRGDKAGRATVLTSKMGLVPCLHLLTCAWKRNISGLATSLLCIDYCLYIMFQCKYLLCICSWILQSAFFLCYNYLF